MVFDDPIIGVDASTDDAAAMLRALADAGWRPLLYYHDDGPGHRSPDTAWVAYPQAEVRYWRAFRGADPVTVIRALYRHALQHPNRPPAPPTSAPPTVPCPTDPIAEARPYRMPPPPAPAGEETQPVTPVAVAPGAIAHVTHRGPTLVSALGELARAGMAALRASVPQEHTR